MQKKFTGENSKAIAARERKAEVKRVENEKRQKAADDAFWVDNDKNVQKKLQRKEGDERKKLETLKRKEGNRQAYEDDMVKTAENTTKAPQKVMRGQLAVRGDTMRQVSRSGDRDRGRFTKNLLNKEIEVLYAEKLNGLKIIQEKAIGKVKWYSVLRHFGFIEIDSAFVKDENTDVFVHQYSIIESHTRRRCYRTLEGGEFVQFDIAEGEKGREAVNITGLNGKPVIGSWYQMLQVPWMRRAFFQHRQEMSSRKEDKSGEVKSKDDRKPNNGSKGEKKEKPSRRGSSLKFETDKKREESRGRGRAADEKN